MLAQTAFHRVFQLLSQMAHIRFRSRKRVHTRLCSKDRTQRITGRNRGCFRWGAITTLGAFRTFTNIPGPGIRTAYFAAFGSWPGVRSRRTQRAFGTAMRSCASLSRGVAAPLGCVIFFCFCRNCSLYTLRSVLSECARRGVVSLPSACSVCC